MQNFLHFSLKQFLFKCPISLAINITDLVFQQPTPSTEPNEKHRP